LVDKHGQVTNYYKSKTKPSELAAPIQELLKASL